MWGNTVNNQLWVTHTGDSDLVSIFDVAGQNRENPLFLQAVQAGASPFGIAAVPAIPEPGGMVLMVLGIITLGYARRSAPTLTTFGRVVTN